MASLQQALEEAKFGIAIDLRDALQDAAPVDKGRLKGSIKVKPSADGVIITMVDYAKDVEFGTNPHIIKPVKKKALKWKGKDGKPVFSKKVMHPGTRPNPFIRTTFHLHLGRIIRKNLQLALK